MIQHEEELYRMLDLYNINYDDVCIVGSSVIARAGFRDNNDIDITLKPSAREISEKFRGQSGLIELSENIQACTGRYNIIGISDDELFSDECSESYRGTRIVKFELEIAKKLRRLEPKDQRDLVEIGNSSGVHNFDWGRIFYLAYFNGEKISVNAVVKVSYLRRVAGRIKRIIKSLSRFKF